MEENKGHNIIFVGGTGLYLKSALYDYRFSEENDKSKKIIQSILTKNYYKCV